MSCGNVGINFEIQLALLDTKKVILQYGTLVEFHGMRTLPTIGGEPEIGENSEILRDKYGSIIDRNKTPVVLHAYPIDYSPSSKQLIGLGMTEQIDATIYLSTLQITEKGYIFEDFDTIKTTVIINDVEYKIKDRRKTSQFASTYLYVVLGLKRS